MGSLNELKSQNVLEILNLIWNRENFTKPGIADRTELTGVTVHKTINELLKSGLIVEQGTARSNGGRKATLYRLNESYSCIVGVLMGIDFVHTGVFDLKLRPLHSRLSRRELDYSPGIADFLASEIEAALAEAKLDKSACLAVGFSMPGQVDADSGTVVNLPNVSKWGGIPLKRLMEERLGIPATVDNDNNGSLIAAKWLKLVREDADAVYLSITEGVGAGVMSRGRLVYGKHSNVGEIGHITVRYDGQKCNCGGRGCLETFTANEAVLDRLRSADRGAAGKAVAGADDAVSVMDGPAVAEKELEAFAERALQGERALYEVFEEAAAHIGLALDIVVKAYDPETILLENPWLKKFPELFAAMVDRLYARYSWLHNGSLKIALNTADHLDRIGPAALVLEHWMHTSAENPLIDRLSSAP